LIRLQVFEEPHFEVFIEKFNKCKDKLNHNLGIVDETEREQVLNMLFDGNIHPIFQEIVIFSGRVIFLGEDKDIYPLIRLTMKHVIETVDSVSVKRFHLEQMRNLILEESDYII
jgi:hypothetical protein